MKAGNFQRTNPANIRLDDVFRLCLQKTFSRCLHQDELIRYTHTSSEDVLIKTNILVLVIRFQDVFKTSCKNVFKTSSRRFQDVFKMLSRLLQGVFKTSCQDVFKTSSRRLQDVFKTSSRCFQDVFKTCSRRLAKTS